MLKKYLIYVTLLHHKNYKTLNFVFVAPSEQFEKIFSTKNRLPILTVYFFSLLKNLTLRAFKRLNLRRLSLLCINI